MKSLSFYLKVIGGLIGAGLIVGVCIFLSLKFAPQVAGQKSFGTVNLISDRVEQDAFGTPTAATTLTGNYVTSTSLKLQGFSNLAIGGTYTPKSAGSLLYMQIERSLDGGTTWLPYDVISPATDRVSVYTNSFTTSSLGVPYLIPGSSSSVSGTAMGFSFDTTLAADLVRLSVKEYTTSTYGTINVQWYSTNH